MMSCVCNTRVDACVYKICSVKYLLRNLYFILIRFTFTMKLILLFISSLVCMYMCQPSKLLEMTGDQDKIEGIKVRCPYVDVVSKEVLESRPEFENSKIDAVVDEETWNPVHKLMALKNLKGIALFPAINQDGYQVHEPYVYDSLEGNFKNHHTKNLALFLTDGRDYIGTIPSIIEYQYYLRVRQDSNEPKVMSDSLHSSRSEPESLAASGDSTTKEREHRLLTSGESFYSLGEETHIVSDPSYFNLAVGIYNKKFWLYFITGTIYPNGIRYDTLFNVKEAINPTTKVGTGYFETIDEMLLFVETLEKQIAENSDVKFKDLISFTNSKVSDYFKPISPKGCMTKMRQWVRKFYRKNYIDAPKECMAGKREINKDKSKLD